jgi:hypothetical protein
MLTILKALFLASSFAGKNDNLLDGCGVGPTRR